MTNTTHCKSNIIKSIIDLRTRTTISVASNITLSKLTNTINPYMCKRKKYLFKHAIKCDLIEYIRKPLQTALLAALMPA